MATGGGTPTLPPPALGVPGGVCESRHVCAVTPLRDSRGAKPGLCFGSLCPREDCWGAGDRMAPHHLLSEPVSLLAVTWAGGVGMFES